MGSQQILLGGAAAHPVGQANFNGYDAAGWTCPDGVTTISVCCIGSGGAGRKGGNSRGGGGGGCAYKNNISVTPGVTYAKTAAGWNTPTGDHGGNDGVDSFFKDASGTIICKGAGGEGGINSGRGGGNTAWRSNVGDGGCLLYTSPSPRDS